MYGLSAKKNGRCREVAVVERWPLVKVRLSWREFEKPRLSLRQGFIGHEKKVKFRRIFRDKFTEKSVDFKGIYGANFAEKQSVKTSPFSGYF